MHPELPACEIVTLYDGPLDGLETQIGFGDTAVFRCTDTDRIVLYTRRDDGRFRFEKYAVPAEVKQSSGELG